MNCMCKRSESGAKICGWCTFLRMRLAGEFFLRIRIGWCSMVRCTFSRVLIFVSTLPHMVQGALPQSTACINMWTGSCSTLSIPNCLSGMLSLFLLESGTRWKYQKKENESGKDKGRRPVAPVSNCLPRCPFVFIFVLLPVFPGR